MINPAEVPLHAYNQKARALLPPVAATLAELEARLDRYAKRLRLDDADRQLVAAAEEAVAQARARVADLARQAADEGNQA